MSFNNKNIRVVGPSKEYAEWIKTDKEVLVFTGGSDVSPYLYGEEPHASTITNSERDLEEVKIFKENKNVLKIGICRGSQFLTVMSGGKLFQHINNHQGIHEIETSSGEKYMMPSTHHQMMDPSEAKHNLIAWTPNRSSFYEGSDNQKLKPLEVDPEIVYYPETNSLCIQGHPEYLKQGELHEYLNKLINEIKNDI